MIELNVAVSRLPGATPLSARRDGWWMVAPELDVQALAELMNGHGARLSTITGVARDDGETTLIYHYALDEVGVNFKTQTHNHAILSITPLVRAAAWIEREIHDLYGVEFTGHPNLTRLLRPPQVAEGFFR